MRELRELWFPSNGEEGLHFFISEALAKIGFDADSVERDANSLAKGRVIKDSIHGIIHLSADSAALLDTPMVQRLRHIHQLGFSNLVYPSAEHSRFSHSLGMAGTVQLLSQSSRQNKISKLIHINDFEISEISPEQEKLLIHTALLHDIGHLAFSHVTEKALEQQPDRFFFGPWQLDKARFDARQKLPKLSLAEMISVAIVLSPFFEKLYAHTCDLSHPEARRTCEKIACLIAGVPFDQTRSWALAELISAPAFDADKLDYLRRDSMNCGIPVGLDFPRVLYGTTVITGRGEDFPLRHPRTPVSRKIARFALNPQGLEAIDDLASARSVLYERVYFHKTTRGAERILARVLHSIALTEAQSGKQEDQLRRSDWCQVLRLWTLGDEVMLNRLTEGAPTAAARNEAALVFFRKLPKRAAVIGPQIIVPVSPDVPGGYGVVTEQASQKLAYARLGDVISFGEPGSGDAQREFEDLIADRAIELKSMLESTDFAGAELPPSEMPSRVTFVPPYDPATAEIGQCCIIDVARRVVPSGNWSIAREQSDANKVNRSLGYVFTDIEWRSLVAVATREIVYERATAIDSTAINPLNYSNESDDGPAAMRPLVILDIDDLCEAARGPSEDVHSIINHVARNNRYDKKPRLSPQPNITDEIDKIVTELSGFQGVGEWRVTRESIRYYLSQFPYHLRDDAITFLSSMQFLGRKRLRNGLDLALERFESQMNPEHAVLAPLSPNSGRLVRQLYEQDRKAKIEQRGWHIAGDITEALASMDANSILVLLDDIIASGSQASAQMRALFGQGRNAWPEEQKSERNIFEFGGEGSPDLGKHIKDKLRDCKIAICVIAYAKLADSTSMPPSLYSALQDLGVEEHVRLFTSDEASPTSDIPSDLCEFFQHVGEACLRWCRTRDIEGAPDEDSLQRDALGYDARKGCLATIFNVPTSTVTAIWCPGVVDTLPWVPLLIRRGYQRHLVLP